MKALGDSLKFMSGKNFNYLSQDCGMIGHGSDLLVMVMFFRKFIIPQEALRAFIYSISLTFL
jgi:hypothetical protein